MRRGLGLGQRRPEGGVRIGFLMGRSFTHLSNAEEIVRLLVGWGATAELLNLGDDLFDVAQARLDYDLYVLKGRRCACSWTSSLSCSRAGATSR